jgi:hypothetical protein
MRSQSTDRLILRKQLSGETAINPVSANAFDAGQ